MTIYYPTIPRLKERLYIASSGHSILIYCQSSTIPDRPGIASSNTFCHCPDVKRSNCAPKIITMTTCATDTFNDSSSLSAACQVSMFKFHLWVVEARHTAFQVGPGLKKVPAPIQFFCHSFGLLFPKRLIFKTSGGIFLRKFSFSVFQWA